MKPRTASHDLRPLYCKYNAHQVRLETSDRKQHRTAPNKRHLPRTGITGRDGKEAAGSFAANTLVFDALGRQHVRSLSQSISSRVTLRSSNNFS